MVYKKPLVFREILILMGIVVLTADRTMQSTKRKGNRSRQPQYLVCDTVVAS